MLCWLAVGCDIDCGGAYDSERSAEGSEGHALMFPLLLLVLIFLTTQSFAAEVTGPALVVDGDTVEVGSIKIRLQGIDAPETDQVCLDQKSERWNCGVAARDELSKHTAVAPWKCSGTLRLETAGDCRLHQLTGVHPVSQTLSFRDK